MSPPPCSPEHKRNFGLLRNKETGNEEDEIVRLRIREHASSPELNHQLLIVERNKSGATQEPDAMTVQGAKNNLIAAKRAQNPFVWQEEENEDEKSSFSEVSEMKNSRLSPTPKQGRFFQKGQFKIEVMQPSREAITPQKTEKILTDQWNPARPLPKPIAPDQKNARWALLLLSIAGIILIVELVKIAL